MHGSVGEGMYGKVYSAWDRVVGHHVMVKRQPIQNNALLERELLAFQTLRALPHDNVVKMLDYFEDKKDGKGYFHMVFEACPTDLFRMYNTALGRSGCMPLEAVLRHLRGMCAGVSHLHDVLGVVHGDLSLSNVLVSEAGTVKVTDLGTAHSCHTLLAHHPPSRARATLGAPRFGRARGRARCRRTLGRLASLASPCALASFPLSQLAVRSKAMSARCRFGPKSGHGYWEHRWLAIAPA